ncbi:hypothetical protein ACHAWO_003977 [Cyclotella atomus]|uniref:EF-hand domain-containing protein n=1 Tax=Cyclotella atomus TaxID=382360 RepID=A0ABD3PXP9_9STRA
MEPWPWTGVLETIAKHYDLEPTGGLFGLETFARIFDTIDADRGGSVDMGEMYEALQDAGMDITEEESTLCLVSSTRMVTKPLSLGHFT